MDQIKVKANSGEIFYSGIFEQPAFDLLGAATTPLYRDMLKKLGPYGAAVSTLKVDTTSLAETNISCALPVVNGFFRVRLDRFDLNFARYHEVGMELANTILVEGWSLLLERDPSLVLREHVIALNVNTGVIDRPFRDLVTRFVKVPTEFPPATQAAVGFYFQPDATTGVRLFSVILDRTPDADIFNLRVEFTFRADLASPSSLGPFVDSFLAKQFETLGITWE